MTGLYVCLSADMYDGREYSKCTAIFGHEDQAMGGMPRRTFKAGQ